MPEAQSIVAKYIFLDIVSYSHGRSVEAQTEIISTLNHIVRESVEGFNVPADRLIYLPTGDGICVAFLGVDDPYDVHIQLSRTILAKLHDHNHKTNDAMRRFLVRIGVNSNLDNLVIDVNGQRNVSGAGINLAQRIMNVADGSQIFVGDTVYEILRHREKYMEAFRSYSVQVKHGIHLQVHQLVQESLGLDILTPSQFREEPLREEKLPKLVAYYFAHATRHKDSLRDSLQKHGLGGASVIWIVLLYMLALDSVDASEASDISPPNPDTWGANSATVTEQFQHYYEVDFTLMQKLAKFIEDNHLSDFAASFDSSMLATKDFHFLNQDGRAKLKKEWPNIWREFEISDTK